MLPYTQTSRLLAPTFLSIVVKAGETGQPRGSVPAHGAPPKGGNSDSIIFEARRFVKLGEIIHVCRPEGSATCRMCGDGGSAVSYVTPAAARD